MENKICYPCKNVKKEFPPWIPEDNPEPTTVYETTNHQSFQEPQKKDACKIGRRKQLMKIFLQNHLFQEGEKELAAMTVSPVYEIPTSEYQNEFNPDLLGFKPSSTVDRELHKTYPLYGKDIETFYNQGSSKKNFRRHAVIGRTWEETYEDG